MLYLHKFKDQQHQSIVEVKYLFYLLLGSHFIYLILLQKYLLNNNKGRIIFILYVFLFFNEHMHRLNVSNNLSYIVVI